MFTVLLQTYPEDGMPSPIDEFHSNVLARSVHVCTRRSPSRSYDQMQIKNVFTAVNSATRVTRVNNLKFQIRGRSSITSACFGGNLNRGLNKLHNLNSFYSILP